VTAALDDVADAVGDEPEPDPWVAETARRALVLGRE
jgi:hypothetical protein